MIFVKESSIRTVPLTSLYKVFPQESPVKYAVSHFSAFKNEPLSFQVAYTLLPEGELSASFYVKVESDLPITIYEEGYVPVLQATTPEVQPEAYAAGLFADMLLKKKTNPKIETGFSPWAELYFEKDAVQLHATRDSWKALWFTVNEDAKQVQAGTHTIKLHLYNRQKNIPCGECNITVDILDAALPPQRLYYTNWFHCDCLCDTYGVEMFSERFWEIFRSFVKEGTRHGMNMLLTPCFTPSLDTPIGHYRKKAQLVGVTLKNGEYTFDFSLLQRFIDESRACGIRYFEHSHFFTQWGATAAPQVWATVNGKEKRIFGWNTCAWGRQYTAFLQAYIPALLTFLKAQKLDKKFLFHISDEPTAKMHAGYLKAKKALGNLLDGYTCGDALSDFAFYADGTVQTPIVATPYVKDFFGKCDNLWAYYYSDFCTQGYTNRRITHSPERNRMIGIHLYTHRIKGFLNWGYNYYYDTQSHGIFDPKTEPCCFGGRNPGCSFIVYPATNGTCIPSIRQKVFYEGINDMRALYLLERYIGRKATLQFVTAYYAPIDFSVGAESAEKLHTFRNALNQKITEIIQCEKGETNGNKSV